MSQLVRSTPYTPLDKSGDFIRLLYLEPALSQHDPMICTMKVVSLCDGPVYEALSYVWGGVDSYHQILLDGTFMSVRRNLWCALQTLRAQRFTVTVLWIDALCINQSDLAERGHQVSLMKYVYEQAACVLSWFHDIDTHPDVEILLNSSGGRSFKGSTMSEALGFIRLVASSRDEGVLGSRRAYASYGHYEREWQTVKRFLHHPYWSRLWIVQEFALAENVTFFAAHDSCSWGQFCIVEDVFMTGPRYPSRSMDGDPTAESIFNMFLESPAHGRQTLRRAWSPTQIEESRYKEEQAERLLKLLNISAASFCQDPRDKVYAILGFASENFRRQIDFDYNITLGDLYNSVMSALSTIVLSHVDSVDFGQALQEALTSSCDDPAQRTLLLQV